MIDATRRWFKRNRANLLIGAGVLGASYVAGQYVLGKIQEARRSMGEERTAKENLRRRFAQNQEDCTYTVLALLPTVRDELMGELPVEQITEQLQQERQERLRKIGLSQSEAASSELPSAPPSVMDDGSSSSFVHASQMVGSDMGSSRTRRTKAQLWQEMKINSIARALTCLYTLALLTALTRIQLNLLGRRTYLSSVVSLATPQTQTQSSTISLENHDDDNYDNVYGNDFETNRKYLTFSWWLLHRGSRQIMSRVLVAVKEVFGAVNIREDISMTRLSELLMAVRRKVEGETARDRATTNWLADLLPPREDELFVLSQSQQSVETTPTSSPSPSGEEAPSISRPLRRLLDETADLIDSPTFHTVLTSILDAGFSHLTDVRLAAEAYALPSTATSPAPRITDISDREDTKCKLATILPVFCRQAHAMLVGSGELDALSGVAAQIGTGNGYLGVMDAVPELEGFAAVVYSSNFEYELAEREVAEPAKGLLEGFEVVDVEHRQEIGAFAPSEESGDFVAGDADGALESTEMGGMLASDEPSGMLASTEESGTLASIGEGATFASTEEPRAAPETPRTPSKPTDWQAPISSPIATQLKVPAEPAEPAFEYAWKKAIAAEDGLASPQSTANRDITHPDPTPLVGLDDRPIPVDEVDGR